MQPPHTHALSCPRCRCRHSTHGMSYGVLVNARYANGVQERLSNSAEKRRHQVEEVQWELLQGTTTSRFNHPATDPQHPRWNTDDASQIRWDHMPVLAVQSLTVKRQPPRPCMQISLNSPTGDNTLL